jgi:hypothetical protein
MVAAAVRARKGLRASVPRVYGWNVPAVNEQIGGLMLFHVVWDFVDTSEDGERRSLAVFAKWQPPAGAEFKGFYGFADGTGGVAIIEADSAATLARTTAPWTPWLRFTATPIVPIDESTGIGMEAIAFRDSVA